MTCLVNGTSVAERKLCGIRYYSKPERFPACQKVLLDFTSDYIAYGSGLTLRYRMGDYGKWQCYCLSQHIINIQNFSMCYKFHYPLRFRGYDCLAVSSCMS